jgi:hypothetical protein
MFHWSINGSCFVSNEHCVENRSMPNKNVSEPSILPEDAELKGYRKGNPNGAS